MYAKADGHGRPLQTVKEPVIASQCAHWRGNPLPKMFRFYYNFQENKN